MSFFSLSFKAFSILFNRSVRLIESYWYIFLAGGGRGRRRIVSVTGSMAGGSDTAETVTLTCARCGKPSHLQYVFFFFSFLLNFFSCRRSSHVHLGSWMSMEFEFFLRFFCFWWIFSCLVWACGLGKMLLPWEVYCCCCFFFEKI